MRKLILLTVLFFFIAKAHTQQLHLMSQYMQHNSMYNPAAAGFSTDPFVGVSYRSMWEAFSGNPRTLMVYGDMRWAKMKSGLAGYIYKDQTGPTSRTGVQLAYSYHVKTSEKGALGLGFEIRGFQYAIDKTKLSEALGNDPVISGADNKLKLDAGIGAYYSNQRLSVGASVSQLLQSKLSFANVPGANLRAQLYSHYNLTASYVIPTGDNTKVIPNLQATMVHNAPTEVQIGCMIDYKDFIWWNANYRFNQSWSMQLGLKLFSKLSIVYCYDQYRTPFSDYNTGNNANEVGIRFNLPNKHKSDN